MSTKRYVIAILAVLAMLVAACGGDGASEETTAPGATDAPAATDAPEGTEAPTATEAPTGTEAPAAEGDLVVAVSWNNFNEPRWANFDKPAIVEAVEAAGGSYIEADAGSSAEQQLSDVENLISQGATVLIILAQDSQAILPAVQSALDQGIPVVAYDRLIENPGALYVTFDNVGVGRIEAEAVYGIQPTGNYAIIKGNSADPNADFLREGMEQVIGDAVAAGDINIVCEEYTDNWDPAIAQTTMEQCLTQNNNEIDAALVENDGMAGGVVAALEAQGMAGQIPVSGQDGDPAALNRVALGTQTVSVWKDARVLGQAAGEAAVQMAQGTALGDVEGVIDFDSPGGNTMTTILLEPTPITQDNLNLVVDAGWISQDDLCQGVEAGSVSACG